MTKAGKSEMQKHNWENTAFDEHGEVDVEATRELREYEGRAPLPANPPPGPKYRARRGLNRLKLRSATVRDFMECLIDRASKHRGACYPSLEYIVGWTDRRFETIRAAAKDARRLGLVRIIERGRNTAGQKRSNAYAINWPVLFEACR
jgi:hypothetical protein